eukprot:1869184-Rhodomonas_salina.2
MSGAEECRDEVRGNKGKDNEIKLRKPRALIIAIHKYDHSSFHTLSNALQDGINLQGVLNRMDWEVHLEADVGLAAMRKAIEDFINLDIDDTSCIFAFIGHGFQINGNHYVVPRDARLLDSHRNPAEFEADVNNSCTSLDFVQKLFERKRKGSYPTAFILDCCRSCDFKTQSLKSGSGLTHNASISQPPQPKTALVNSCVVFSTNEGQTASDGKRGHGGPFINTLVQEIPKGGDLSEVLERTRFRLKESSGSGNWQLCPVVTTLITKFHFCPTSAAESFDRDGDSLMSEHQPAGQACAAATPAAAILTIQPPLAEAGADASDCHLAEVGGRASGKTAQAPAQSQGSEPVDAWPFVLVGPIAGEQKEAEYEDVKKEWQGYGEDAAEVVTGNWWGRLGAGLGCAKRVMDLRPSILHIEARTDELSGRLIFDDGEVGYQDLRTVLELIEEDGGRVRLL